MQPQLFLAMHSRKLPHYLRAYRKRLGLSQGEVAFLLGCRSGAKVSRYERFSRTPNLKTVFACKVIFQALGQELFPGVFEAVRSKTRRRARVLIARLSSQESDPLVKSKIAALRSIAGSKVVRRRSGVHA